MIHFADGRRCVATLGGAGNTTVVRSTATADSPITNSVVLYDVPSNDLPDYPPLQLVFGDVSSVGVLIHALLQVRAALSEMPRP